MPKKDEKVIEAVIDEEKPYFFPRMVAYLIDIIIVALISTCIVSILPTNNNYDKYVKETNDLTHTVILSTASPYKFIKTISESLDIDSSLDEFDLIDLVSEKSDTSIPKPLESIKNDLKTNECITLEDAYKYLEKNIQKKES